MQKSKYFNRLYWLCPRDGINSDVVYEMLQECPQCVERDRRIEYLTILCSRGTQYSNQDYDVLNSGWMYATRVLREQEQPA